MDIKVVEKGDQFELYDKNKRGQKMIEVYI